MQAAQGQPPREARPPAPPPMPTSAQQPAFPILAPELAPLAIAAALADSTVVAAALAEAQQRLGCAKCRYSRGGCARCRNPSFRPRPAAGGIGRQQQQQPRGADDGATAPAGPARRAPRGKRQRKTSPGQASSGEPLVHALRRQLQTLQTQPASDGNATAGTRQAGAATLLQPQPAQAAPAAVAGGDAARGGPAATGGGAAGAAAAAAEPEHTGSVQQQQQQQQQQKRAAEASAPGGRPAKFFKADAELASRLQLQQPPAQLGQQPAGQPAGAAAATEGDGKRGASSEPSPGSRRPSKRQRPHASPAGAKPDAAAAEAAPAGEAGPAAPPTGSASAEAGAAAKRPPPQQQQHRPAKFRRVVPPAELEQPGQAAASEQQQHEQQEQQAHSQGSGGGADRMEVDPFSPRKRGAAERESTDAGAGGAGPQAAAPSPVEFLAKLQERMQVRHQERQAVDGGTAQLPLLALAAGKRRKQSPKAAAPAGHSPAASRGAAPVMGPAAHAGAAAAAETAEEPDPRLCLWEPPASPFGLLEEELFEDPWKLLVACMLLNKTSGAQVRKVIWDLFELCPTPAAAIAADVQQVQNLIQPLGLFRKRALAIQQLSHDYLYKQWRSPTELFGIGKYAADAYLMFCRNRWREVQPDDKDLRKYRDWLEQTGGLGTGLTRHRTMPPAAPAGATARRDAASCTDVAMH